MSEEQELEGQQKVRTLTRKERPHDHVTFGPRSGQVHPIRFSARAKLVESEIHEDTLADLAANGGVKAAVVQLIRDALAKID